VALQKKRMKNNSFNYVSKDWGSEFWLVNNELYCAKILNCNGNWSSNGRYHYHKNKDETFIVMSGEILLDVEGEELVLKELESYRIKPKVRHRFKGLPEGQVLEVSTHHEDSDSIYVK